MTTKQYVDWNVFESLPVKSYEITYTKAEEEITIEKAIKKLICQAPIGSGKSTSSYSSYLPLTSLRSSTLSCMPQHETEKYASRKMEWTEDQ